MIDLATLTTEVADIARQTGEWIARQQLSPHEVEQKGSQRGNNFVTYVDREAEKQIVSQLRKLFPQAGFITEEGTATNVEEYNWVIDPLDGTTNFIHGLRPVAVSIALVHHHVPQLGVVYEVGLKENFTAYRGGQMKLNGEKVALLPQAALSETLVCADFPAYSKNNHPFYQSILTEFDVLSHGHRNAGSAATALAYVAAGRYGLYFQRPLSPWDMAAGACLVREAGGVATTFNGDEDFLHSKEIVAATPTIHPEAIRIIKKHKECHELQ